MAISRQFKAPRELKRSSRRYKLEKRMRRGGDRTLPTGVTPGTPGSFTPAASRKPTDIYQIRRLGALGQGAAWSVGQYVVLGNGRRVHWNGAGPGWVAGAKV